MTTTARVSRPYLERRWQKILGKMQDQVMHLQRQGVIVSKISSTGRRVWALRFCSRDQGRRVHRSIYLGGDDQPELLRRARLLLQEYRSRAGWAKEIATYAQFAAGANAALKRLGVGVNKGRVSRFKPLPRV